MQILLKESQTLLERYKDSFKSKETAKMYCNHLLGYCTDLTSLLDLTQKEAENKLIDFIVQKKNGGMLHGQLHNFVSSVIRFYLINDIFLNSQKIHRFMPEPVKAAKDRAYSQEEIQKMLELSDERTKVIILLFTSSGIRLGAVPKLVYSDLEEREDIYKITVYANTKAEYYTYCTPECKQALDSYFAIRKRHGEKFTGKTPVIREQYNKRIGLMAYPRFISKELTRRLMLTVMETAGLRTAIHSTKKAKHDVMAVHGFRKFFNTQLVKSKINPLIKEMLMGHKVGLEVSYYRPEEEDVYQEYCKAIDLLTINPENRLRKQVEMLTVEKSKVDLLEEKINKLSKLISSVQP